MGASNPDGRRRTALDSLRAENVLGTLLWMRCQPKLEAGYQIQVLSGHENPLHIPHPQMKEAGGKAKVGAPCAQRMRRCAAATGATPASHHGPGRWQVNAFRVV